MGQFFTDSSAIKITKKKARSIDYIFVFLKISLYEKDAKHNF